NNITIDFSLSLPPVGGSNSASAAGVCVMATRGGPAVMTLAGLADADATAGDPVGAPGAVAVAVRDAVSSGAGVSVPPAPGVSVPWEGVAVGVGVAVSCEGVSVGVGVAVSSEGVALAVPTEGVPVAVGVEVSSEGVAVAVSCEGVAVGVTDGPGTQFTSICVSAAESR